MSRIFRDRIEAAEELASALERYRGEPRPLVLAIPRGAVPMAAVLARALDADLDVALVRKIGAPGNPELAIGAVSEFGDIYRGDSAEYFNISDAFMEQAAERERLALAARRRQYTPVRRPFEPRGRVVILVDDGLATGATMMAAVEALRKRGPAKLVVATPVASLQAARLLAGVADDFVALEVPEYFGAVSEFYDQFEQVEDSEVIAALEQAARRESAA